MFNFYIPEEKWKEHHGSVIHADEGSGSRRRQDVWVHQQTWIKNPQQRTRRPARWTEAAQQQVHQCPWDDPRAGGAQFGEF